jgi:hypothetical protein
VSGDAGGRARALVAWAALAAYAALLWATAPAWPDDWDGVGFVESVRAFDLARFQPHPPGYPVYVALLRVAAVVTRDPMRACVLVAVASGSATAAFAWSAARRALGGGASAERAAWRVAPSVAATSLAWRACSDVGSEAPALAFAAACAWAVATLRSPSLGGRAPTPAIALGLAAGLGLGVRLSWAPLYLALLLLAPRGARLRAGAAAALTSAASATALAAIVGPAKLVALLSTHFAGHAERWGGTVVTAPGPVRLVWLARDVLVDGFGASNDTLGIAIGVLGLAAAAQGLLAWRAAGWRGWRIALLVVAPYLLWIGFAQNLRDQPRHALPLVVALAVGLALSGQGSRRASALVGSLLLLVAVRTACDAHARRTVPPPGQQLVELARAQPQPARLAVFGVSSVRFFETTELAPHAFAAGSLGDVQVRLTRVDALPTRVWVTSEVGREESPWPLAPVAKLCRPARLDRRAPCLDVFAWRLPYLPDR